MSLQPLPDEFKDSIRNASQAQQIDHDEVIHALSQAIIGDILDYNIWTGPGPNNLQLLLDIYAITPKALFGHEVHGDGVTGTAIIFVDAISEINSVKINDDLADYSALITKNNGEASRVFSNEDGIQALRSFCRTLTQARNEITNLQS